MKRNAYLLALIAFGLLVLPAFADREMFWLNPVFHANDDNGNPLSGGQLFSYAAGTVIKKPLYTEADGATEHENPIVLNSRGEAEIFGDGLYYLKLLDSGGITIWTVDNVRLFRMSDLGAALISNSTESGMRDTLDLGTAAIVDTGTAAGTIPLLDAVGLPAIDGSQLTGINPNSADALVPMAYLAGYNILPTTDDVASASTWLYIKSGVCKDNSNTVAMERGNGLTKKLDDPFVAGDLNGGRATDVTKMANKWYDVFVIKNTSLDVVDVCFGYSDTSLTLPSGYGYSRRIGSFRTNAEQEIEKFYQDGDWFYWKRRNNDVSCAANAGNLSRTAKLYTLHHSPPMSTIVLCDVGIRAIDDGNENVILYISDTQSSDVVNRGYPGGSRRYGVEGLPTLFGSNIFNLNTRIQIHVDSSQQFYASGEDGHYANIDFWVNTIGWRDYRGKND